jgi:hypothetical protein
VVARFARNAPGTWFQKYQVKLRAAEVTPQRQLMQTSGGKKSSCSVTENTQLSNDFAN